MLSCATDKRFYIFCKYVHVAIFKVYFYLVRELIAPFSTCEEKPTPLPIEVESHFKRNADVMRILLYPAHAEILGGGSRLPVQHVKMIGKNCISGDGIEKICVAQADTKTEPSFEENLFSFDARELRC